MQILQNTIGAIKHFHRRQDTNAKIKAEVDGMIKIKKCVECGDHVPAYQNFLCEKCWSEALKEKLNE